MKVLSPVLLQRRIAAVFKIEFYGVRRVFSRSGPSFYPTQSKGKAAGNVHDQAPVVLPPGAD
jgi:hypothetical protein